MCPWGLCPGDCLREQGLDKDAAEHFTGIPLKYPPEASWLAFQSRHLLALLYAEHGQVELPWPPCLKSLQLLWHQTPLASLFLLPSLCPWPKVTCGFTKQSFLSYTPSAPRSLPLTYRSPHHPQRSVYKGHACSLAHKNFVDTSRFFSPCPLSSNVHICTIHPGTEKSEILQTSP